MASSCLNGLPVQRAPIRLDRLGREGLGWIAGLAAIAVVLLFGSGLAPWTLMWLLAGTIFATFKLLTVLHLSQAERIELGWARLIQYLLLWPGMRPRLFIRHMATSPTTSALWRAAVLNLSFGAALLGASLWALPDTVPVLLRAWLGMIGFVFLVHFGAFDLLAAVWRRRGVPVEKLFDCPIRSVSLGEFWGRRWNRVFSDFARELVFRPLARRWGVVTGTLAVFLLSGLAHELVITVPAGIGYGGPTAYFLIQGALVLAENRQPFRRWSLKHPLAGWALTMLALLLPVPLLFPEGFVTDVIAPFFGALGGNT